MKKLFLLTLTSFFLAGCNRLDVHQPQTNAYIKYDQAKVVAQSFVANRNNLNIVSLCIRNPARVLAPFRFELVHQQSGRTLRSIDFSGGNIDNMDCTKFQFDPITDSQNQTYELKIISPVDVEDETVLPRGGVYVEAFSDASYPYGTALLDGHPLDKDLHFKTFYFQSLSEVTKESYTQFFHRLTLDPLFLVLYTLLLIWVIYLLCLPHAKTSSH